MLLRQQHAFQLAKWWEFEYDFRIYQAAPPIDAWHSIHYYKNNKKIKLLNSIHVRVDTKLQVCIRRYLEKNWLYKTSRQTLVTNMFNWRLGRSTMRPGTWQITGSNVSSRAAALLTLSARSAIKFIRDRLNRSIEQVYRCKENLTAQWQVLLHKNIWLMRSLLCRTFVMALERDTI